MRDLQTLIAKLGRPPAAICLDWAWQLRDLQSQSLKNGHSEGSDPPRTSSLPCLQLSWSHFTIREDGKLVVDNTKVATTDATLGTDHLRDEAIRWARESDPGKDFAPTDVNDYQLRFLTMLAVNTNSIAGDDPEWIAQNALEQWTIATAPSNKTSRGEQQGGGRNPVAGRRSRVWDAADDTADDTAAGRLTESLAKPRTTRRRRSPFPWMAVSRMGRAYALFGVIAAVMLAATWTWIDRQDWIDREDWNGRGDRGNRDRGGDRETAPAGPDIFQAGSSSVRTNTGADESRILNSHPDVQTLLANEFEGRVELSQPELGSDLPDAISLLDVESVLDIVIDHESELHSTTPAVTLAASQIEMSTNRSIQVGGGMSDFDLADAGALEEGAVDVLSTLADFAKQAESENAATDLDSDEVNQQGREPLVISTAPMVQVLEMPKRLVGRVRNPVWSVRLACGEGLVVDPEAAQWIEGRNVATWRIQAKDADEDPSAQILIQAQIFGNRGTSLRWRIAAESAALPQVQLPLEQRYLDILQFNLLRFQDRLRLAIEQLKTINDSGGLPSAAKGALSVQRRGFESQWKLAGVALDVAASASRLDGWLDGQFEAHLLYRDGTDGESPPLLQYGMVEVVPESDTAVTQDASAASTKFDENEK